MTQRSPRMLPTRAVRERYGVSDMTIYRWRHDPKLDFPKPVEIRGQLYFDEAALDAFDKAHRTSVVT